MEADQTPPKPVKKRVRKPRGRGLRTKTGCLTCRKRHKKCDERMPICGPCIVSNRECTYPEDVEALRAQPSASNSPSQQEAEASNSNQQPNHHPQHHPQPQHAHHSQQQHLIHPVVLQHGIATLDDGAAPRHHPAASIPGSMNYAPSARSNHQQQPRDIVDPAIMGMYPNAAAAAGFKPAPPPQAAQYHLQGSYAAGPADHSQWFDLLATDAAQATDGHFSLSQGAPSDGDASSLQLPDGLGSAARAYDEHTTGRLATSLVDLSNSYSPSADIKLSAHEAALFRNFAEKTASWLDVFDPQKHFSTYVTRLAMRNQGLMKAILAFSARYSQIATTTRAGHNNPALELEPLADPNEAIQHYNEGLNHMQKALHVGSTKSEELLSMALVISTYEMLETGSSSHSSNNSNWQRHLEGVFSLQHARNVNGESGGLHGAAWWAWLRQDLWAAFRERRKCFSTWRPTIDYPDLRQSDMPDRAIYLLSLAVNYCADPSPDPRVEPEKAAKMARRAAELLDMLERWKGFLGDAYKALPTAGRAAAVHGWTPTWVHPPEYGVALQVYSFAKILVCMHRPVVDEFNHYLITEAVATICGIAMELTEMSCQIISSQCLFAAGLCVQDPRQQHTIMSLIDACEARTGWPMDNLRGCLYKQWKVPKD